MSDEVKVINKHMKALEKDLRKEGLDLVWWQLNPIKGELLVKITLLGGDRHG
jgi:hypothetical protein